MSVVTVAVSDISEYSEAYAVMIFCQVGGLSESFAVGKSRVSTMTMTSIVSGSANMEQDRGIEEVDPDEVEVGEAMLIHPSEKVPLDGTVLEGSSFLGTAALIGELVSREVYPGDAVINGRVNGEIALCVKTSKVYEDSTVTRILQLVESISGRKTRMKNFIIRSVRWYTPIVTVTAPLLVSIPPLSFGMLAAPWIERAYTFLIVSCSCALAISVPLGFFGGVDVVLKRGVPVKGLNFPGTAAESKTPVFNKTGTLIRGEFRVVGIHPTEGCSGEEFLSMAVHGEGLPSHLIAQSILQAYGSEVDRARLGEMCETVGHGPEGMLDGRELLLGNEKLFRSKDIDFPAVKEHGTVIHAVHGGSYVGHIITMDVVKPGAVATLRQLRRIGIERLVMLTGDRKDATEAITAEVSVDTVYHGLLPVGRVEKVEALFAVEKNDEKVGFAGDGINDASVLTRVDVGIATSSFGNDAVIEVADLVITNDEFSRLVDITHISRRTVRIARQSIASVLTIRATVLILDIFELVSMWEAVFGDVGVTVIAVLNAMRALTPQSVQH